MFENVKCLMFDLDGTVVDSESIATRVILQEINSQLGLEMDAETYDVLYLGRDAAFMTEDLTVRYGAPLPDDFMPSLGRSYHGAVTRLLKPSVNVEWALQQLSLPRCIVSNSAVEFIELSIDSVGLTEYFDGRYFSGVDAVKSKPAPDVYLTAAATMGFDPSECLAIEDSPTGIAAAQGAGMQLLAYVGNTAGNEQTFEDHGLTVMRDFRELPALLGIDVTIA